MQRITKRWFRRWDELTHVCERCGDIDDASVDAPLRCGEVACWRCVERAGEFIPVRVGESATPGSGNPTASTAGATV
jgi:hypothetical protein